MKAMIDLEVVYEDNHIIVINKPCNILSQADNTKDVDLLTIIKEYLKVKYQKPGNVYLGLVHRLDRVVGGLMVFAKTSKAAARLSESIKNHSFKKEYLAVVHGQTKQSEELTDYLEKQSDYCSIVTDSKHGSLAKLSYQLLEYHKDTDLSLLNISLETGRHHQIRVQLSSRGYPIYGDNRYGKGEKEPIALFAYKLSFKHPVKDEIMNFELIPQNTAFKFFKIKKKGDAL